MQYFATKLITSQTMDQLLDSNVQVELSQMVVDLLLFFHFLAIYEFVAQLPQKLYWNSGIRTTPTAPTSFAGIKQMNVFLSSLILHQASKVILQN